SIATEKGPGSTVFHPGMSATVDIRTRKVQNVLSVPIQSVTTRDTAMTEDKPAAKSSAAKEATAEVECVFVVSAGKIEQRAVTIGLQDNTYIEITKGLKDGEEVVSAPYSAISRLLSAGDEVKVVDKDALYTTEEK
ncbi:MAG: efflux RND transporter periplasmic adaptor subunit, partial [Flavobacteriales bacterium]